jgi:predicted amidohydrolase YtcJ
MNRADLILISSAIFDSVQDAPFPGAVAVTGNKILAVGSLEEISKYVGEETIVRDFGDKLIMPGFCDGHGHYDGLANKAFAEVVSGLEDQRSEEDCARIVKEFADENPHIKRISGFGWMLTNWGANPKRPTKTSLDNLVPDKPVYLQSGDGHAMWLNSKAIEECRLEEILRNDSEITENLAPRDSSGKLTGFFAERAGSYTHSFKDADAAEQRPEYHKKLVKLLNQYGITGFTDVTMMPHDALAGYYAPLKSLENDGELTIRCYIWAGAGPAGSVSTEDAAKIRSYEAFLGSDKLRIAGIKSMMDGIPFNYTAALLEPYTDNSEVRGEILFPPEIYEKWVEGINRLGYAIKFHCCGDAAIRLALDCFEKSNSINDNTNLRNAIEHLDIVTAQDIPRLNQLGVIASVQPAHPIMARGILAVRYGERSKREWNFRKLINSGARLSVGTDTPVVHFNPLLTVYKAVTRKDIDGARYSPYTADQAMTLAEVLKGYTIGSAYASNMNQKVGTLEAGKYADIAVIDRNLFDITADEIKDSRVVCTVFDGKVVCEA